MAGSKSLAGRVCLLLALLSLYGCIESSTSQENKPGWIDEARLANTPLANDNWLTVGGNGDKNHFSSLTDINTDNVSRLGFAWEFQTNTNRGLEATPIVVDGVMYTSGVAGRVYALDAATGKPLWTFEPTIDMQVNRYACCDMVNRGVAVWKGRVYVVTLDGWLYALDAANGKVAWKVDTITDRKHGYTSTGAPQIAGDVVVIGNAGAEYDARGYVTAYKVDKGTQAWRFFTVPGDPRGVDQPELAAAAKTWSASSRYDIGVGGTVWDGMVFDPKLNLLYIGVGNAGPWPAAVRSPGGGDNLYVGSIVAIDPRTGRMKWYYQQTPGDQWDFTSTQPMILADWKVDGKLVPVILQAPKNGFFYVINRQTGRLISAKPFARMNWASGIDTTSGRPIVDKAAADYSDGPKIVYPSSSGAHSWQPMAYDPRTGLVYIPTSDVGNLLFINDGKSPPRKVRRLNNGATLVMTSDLKETLPSLSSDIQAEVRALPAFRDLDRQSATGFLQAFDPNTGRTVWKVPTARWDDRNGVLATAGNIIVQGSDAGNLRVLDSKSGKLIKSIETGTSIMAAPMTYRVKGVQYIAVMAGAGGDSWGYPRPGSAQEKYGNAGRILVFRLDGGAVPVPAHLTAIGAVPAPPPQFGNAKTIEVGRMLFSANCTICHSNMPRGNLPDLTRMQPGTHEAFDKILLEGLLKDGGMPAWGDVFSKSQAHSIHAYLISVQAKAYAAERVASPTSRKQ